MHGGEQWGSMQSAHRADTAVWAAPRGVSRGQTYPNPGARPHHLLRRWQWQGAWRVGWVMGGDGLGWLVGCAGLGWWLTFAEWL